MRKLITRCIIWWRRRRQLLANLVQTNLNGRVCLCKRSRTKFAVISWQHDTHLKINKIWHWPKIEEGEKFKKIFLLRSCRTSIKLIQWNDLRKTHISTYVNNVRIERIKSAHTKIIISKYALCTATCASELLHRTFFVSLSWKMTPNTQIDKKLRC